MMCSGCAGDYESDDTGELIEQGAEAADNLRYLLDNPEELLPFEEDDTDMEDVA